MQLVGIIVAIHYPCFPLTTVLHEEVSNKMQVHRKELIIVFGN